MAAGVAREALEQPLCVDRAAAKQEAAPRRKK
jgi:hypothetical protein